MKEVKRNILLNPGPATTTDRVKYAQVIPDICPREKEFGDLMRSISKDLTTIAGGKKETHTCILFGGSGTAAVESMLTSVIPPGKKALIINNGAYGERMVKIASAFNIPFVEVKQSWEELADIERAREALEQEEDIGALFMVHHETTTGLLNPIKEFGALAKEKEAVFCVDTISSFAGIEFDMDAYNIDFMASTSNKCLQGMAGVCFIICKQAALDAIKEYPRHSFYLSLYDQHTHFEQKGQMRFTPPVQTLYALREAIDEFNEEGLAQRAARYTENWKMLREGVDRLGFRFLSKPEEESHILLTLYEPEDENYSFKALHDALYEKGFTIYPGKVTDLDTFRLANMGAIGKEDIISFLKALEETIEEQGITMRKEEA